MIEPGEHRGPDGLTWWAEGTCAFPEDGSKLVTLSYRDHEGPRRIAVRLERFRAEYVRLKKPRKAVVK